jgi:hypothetical protein
VNVTLSGANQLVVSWQASQGATSYLIERSFDDSTWSAIATGVTSTSFVDSGLNYATSYYYRILAMSDAGLSGASAAGAATTLLQPDVLTAQALGITLTRGVSFTGPVAKFEDENLATTAGQFVATIHWDNGRTSAGTVIGQDGTFNVIGTHVFTHLGVHRIQVTVTAPDPDTVTVTSTADVKTRTKRRLIVRARRVSREATRRSRDEKRSAHHGP